LLLLLLLWDGILSHFYLELSTHCCALLLLLLLLCNGLVSHFNLELSKRAQQNSEKPVAWTRAVVTETSSTSSVGPEQAPSRPLAKSAPAIFKREISGKLVSPRKLVSGRKLLYLYSLGHRTLLPLHCTVREARDRKRGYVFSLSPCFRALSFHPGWESLDQSCRDEAATERRWRRLSKRP
jgi:hypothetical protein